MSKYRLSPIKPSPPKLSKTQLPNIPFGWRVLEEGTCFPFLNYG